MAILQSEKSIFQLPPNNVDLFVNGRQTYYRSNMEFVDGVLPVEHGGTGGATFEEGNLLAYKDGTFVSSKYTDTYFDEMEERFRSLGSIRIAKADGTILPQDKDSRIVTLPDFLSHEGGNVSGSLNYSKRTATFLEGAKGDAFYNSVVTKGRHQILAKFNSVNGVFMDSVYYNQRLVQYMSNDNIAANKNEVTHQAVLLDEAGNTQFPGKVTADSFTGDLHGEAEYAYDARALGGKSPAYYLDYINLTNVPNDMDKPVSNAQEAAIKAAVAKETERATKAEGDINDTIAAYKVGWDDKYTKNEVDNLFAMAEQKIDWKESVDTYADIATTYPHPEDGWRVTVRDTDIGYQWDGNKWIAVTVNSIPKATQTVDGLLSKEDKAAYDDANQKKHVHNNHALLNRLTDGTLDKVPNVATNDQVVEFQETPVLRELTSGEKIKISFGKIGKAIKELIAHIGNTKNPHGVTKEQLHMEYVENTADIDKPVSTAQQEALDKKAPIHSPVLTGVPETPTPANTVSDNQIASTEFVHGVVEDALDGYTENLPFRAAIIKGFVCENPDDVTAWLADGGLITLPITYKCGWAYRVVDPHHTNILQGQAVKDGELLVAMADRMNDYHVEDWMILPNGGVSTISGGDTYINTITKNGRDYKISHKTKSIITNKFTPENEAKSVTVIKGLILDDCGHANSVETTDIPLVSQEMLNTAHDQSISYANQKYEQSIAYTDQKIDDLVGGASGTMDTLKEIEDAYNDHKEVADAITEAISKKASQTSLDQLSQTVKTIEAAVGTSDSALTTHVDNKGIHVTAQQVSSWNSKVDAIAGMGLSHNDFTDALKTKLNGIATGANKYVHPTSAGNKHIPAGGATGQILRWSAAGTAVWGSDNNTTYGVATTEVNGLMSAADKTKLNGIATRANKYVHPTSAGNKHIPAGGATGNILGWSSAGTARWIANNAVCSQKLGRDGNNGNPMTFHWSGQGGYPSWYWGGSDGTNMYVYNPLNLPFLRSDVACKANGNFSVAGTMHVNTITLGEITENSAKFGRILFNTGTGTAGGTIEAFGNLLNINPAGNLDGMVRFGIYDNGHRIMPYRATYVTLGCNSHPFGLLYTNGSPAIISDRRKKKNVAPIKEKITSNDIKGFLKELSLVWYRLKEQDEGQHIGLIAQDVEPLLKKYHLPEDWSFFHKTETEKEDGEVETNYSLSYDQLFFLLLQVLQDDIL